MPTRVARRSRKDPTTVRPKLQYSIVASALQPIPQMPGQNAIIAPFDTITRHVDSLVPLQFVILNCWTSGFGHFSEYVTITDPNGDLVVQTQETQFWLPNQFHRHNVNHNIQVALQVPGYHAVNVHLDNQSVLEYKLKFVVQPATTLSSQG